MDVLENLQTLQNKNFWESIATAEMDGIRPAIYEWKKKCGYNNPLVDFFCALQSFHITEEKIEFYNTGVINSFSEEDCVLLFQNIDKIKNSYIKVLFLGFLWQYKKLPDSKDNFRAALGSLQTYLEILDVMSQQFQPPYSLSIRLYFSEILAYGVCTAERLKQATIRESFLLKTMELVNMPYSHDNFLFIESSFRTLINHCSVDEIKGYIPRLEELLQKTAAEPLEQHQIFDLMIQAVDKAGDRRKVQELLKQKAALFEKEAHQINLIHQEIHLLQKAASIYVNLPDCHQKWEQLIQEIENKSPRILDTLVSIPIQEKIDTSRILQSEKDVAAKSLQESLKEVAKCLALIPTQQDIEETRPRGILSDIFAANIIDEKGFTSSILDEKNSHPMSFYMILQWYWADTCVHALAPMLSRITLDHFFTTQDLIPFCVHNPFVPVGREAIFAKGLYYFLKQDLVTSSSLLIPQLENSFRNLLYGIKPITKLDSVGRQPYKIEMKWLLNTLLDEKRITNKIYFNLKMLLCTDYFNVRNKMAHGLWSGQNFYSPSVFILNWFIFYFTCYPTLFYEEIVATREERAKSGSSISEK